MPSLRVWSSAKYAQLRDTLLAEGIVQARHVHDPARVADSFL